MMRFAGDLGYLVGPLSIGALVDVTSIGHAGGLAVNAAFLAVFAILFALLAGRRTARPFR
jgi:fucose permease